MRSEFFTQILRFGVVGGIGFVVDGGLLWMLLSQELSAYLARALSFPVAVVITWALNRSWTFATTRHANPKGQFTRYFGVQIIGTLMNYVVYSVVLAFFGTGDLIVFLGFMAGSFIGALLNFCGARYVAFRA